MKSQISICHHSIFDIQCSTLFIFPYTRYSFALKRNFYKSFALVYYINAANNFILFNSNLLELVCLTSMVKT